MRALKKEIMFLLLLMTIGIAAVTTNVIVNMSTPINQNPDDFLVYFSDVKVDGTQDLSLVRNEQKLEFSGEFSAVGDKKVISYDVTNASKNYDAEVTISCTESTKYLTVTNVFDTTNNLSARSTKTGTLTVELSTAVSEETLEEVTCTLSASAVERTSQGSGNVVEPLAASFQIVSGDGRSVGDEISLGAEKFNIISVNDETVTLLAQYNITDAEPYKQTTTQSETVFSETDGWEYTPGPKEIDVQTWGGDVKTVLNGYVDYLNNEYGFDVTGDFITLTELGELGCTVPSDYAYDDGDWTCEDSEYSDWLVNGQYWWTRSAISEDSGIIWFVDDVGIVDIWVYDDVNGVRPVIEVPIEDIPKIISFTVDGDTYQALEGMTWADWIDSDYNTDNYYTIGNLVYVSNYVYVQNISSTNIIGNGSAYTTESEEAENKLPVEGNTPNTAY